jgi:hypothetical protein
MSDSNRIGEPHLTELAPSLQRRQHAGTSVSRAPVMPPLGALECDDFARLLALAEYGHAFISGSQANLAPWLHQLSYLKLWDYSLVNERRKGRGYRYELTERGRQVLAHLAALREAVGPVRMLILSTMRPGRNAADLLHDYQALAAHGLCK